MTKAHLDFETRSAVDLKKAGAYRYAEDLTTAPWLFSYRVGDGPILRWHPGDEDPLDLLAHIEDGGEVVAHNAGFERAIWNRNLRRALPHWPELRVEQQDCTMARAVALALPAGLDQLGKALKLRFQKDEEGSRLMMRMCRPRRIDADGTVVWWDDAERIARLGQYCDRDIETEEAADEALPLLSASEKEVWRLDQRINDRGVAIDVPLIERALTVVAEATKRADERMWWLTDGEVRKCSEAAKIVAWLNTRGIPATSVAKGEIEEIVLSAEIHGDDTAKEVVQLRRSAAKTSTAKYKAMLNSVCADGRVRGTLAYHGAGTGRWAGRLIQPQNFPRVDEDRLPDIERLIAMLGSDTKPGEIVDALEMLTGQPMTTLSQALRPMIIAPPGKKLVGGDYSNIEGRVNAWLAGEAWKVKAFADFDRGIGADLYKLSYAKSFNVDVAGVTKAERQIGKVQELALGYQGGVGAFQTMASAYGMVVTDDRADEIKLAWRAAHPAIKDSWYELQDAAIDAVAHPGVAVPALPHGRVQYLAANGFLFCRLPSARVIAYAAPRLVLTETKNGGKRRQIEYDGVDSYTKRWGPQRLYGGLQCENIVQAVARDVLVEAMFRAEAAGYPLVLTVHDELICETPADDEHTAEGLEKIMAVVPEWATGLPVAAGTWEDYRYAK